MLGPGQRTLSPPGPVRTELRLLTQGGPGPSKEEAAKQRGGRHRQDPTGPRGEACLVLLGRLCPRVCAPYPQGQCPRTVVTAAAVHQDT